MRSPSPTSTGFPLEVIATSELDRPEYARNDGQRCFHCKDELFAVMEDLRAARGFDAIAYGVNLDDQGDFRPGQQAAAQHHVAAPLLEGWTHQAGNPRTRAPGRPAHLGQARIRLSLVAHRIRPPGDARSARRRRTRRRRHSRARLPAIPRAPSRRHRPHRDRPRRTGARPESRHGRGVHQRSSKRSASSSSRSIWKASAPDR